MKQCVLELNKIAPASRRREETRARLKAGLAAWAGPCVLALLFLASLAYVAVDDKLAASSALKPELSIALVSATPADTGVATHDENASGESLVVRCDKSAVVAANRIHGYGSIERGWRRDRQVAFRGCMDEPFQNLPKLHF